MRVASFACPYCSTPLRVRDRRFVGQTIACPDCGEQVEIRESDAGDVTGVARTRDAIAPDSSRTRSAFSPAAIGQCVAGCLVIGLLVFLVVPNSRTHEPASPPLEAATFDPAARIDDVRGNRDSRELSPSLEQRFEKLHGPVVTLNATTRQFPRGTIDAAGLAPEQRFGWQAALVAQRDWKGPQPHWDRPWNDPVNDPFVRRQQPSFLNPRLTVAVTDDRYPATHYVGVAGFGDDAASLPSNSPRAGIFGHDRQTRLDDVGDGLAQTMLVVGVTEQLGSWAAGGPATVRGFSGEPYINGPDGIGTGDAGGMHVLMADGSLRFLPKDTSPQIIRRMAAMNDGLPIDEAVPGEPGAVPTPEPAPQLAAGADAGPAGPVAEPIPADAEPEAIDAARIIADIVQPAELPIDVPMAEPVVEFDIERALSQRIVRFDQRDPVPVRDLLRLVEEMAAVPIHFNELAAESVPRLADPVRLTRENTTVGEILQAIVEAASLTFEGRPSGIFIRAPQPPISGEPN